MEQQNFDYRICFHKMIHNEEYYEIHKVYYKKDGTIDRIIDAHPIIGKTISDMNTALGMMLWADKKPIIDYSTKKEIE